MMTGFRVVSNIVYDFLVQFLRAFDHMGASPSRGHLDTDNANDTRHKNEYLDCSCRSVREGQIDRRYLYLLLAITPLRRRHLSLD